MLTQMVATAARQPCRSWTRSASFAATRAFAAAAAAARLSISFVRRFFFCYTCCSQSPPFIMDPLEPRPAGRHPQQYRAFT